MLTETLHWYLANNKEIRLLSALLDRFLESYKDSLGSTYKEFYTSVSLKTVRSGFWLQIKEESFELPQLATKTLLESSSKPEDIIFKWFEENIANRLQPYIDEMTNQEEHRRLLWDKSLKQRLHSYTKKSLFKE